MTVISHRTGTEGRLKGRGRRVQARCASRRFRRLVAGVGAIALVLSGELKAQAPPVDEEPAVPLVHLRRVDASILQDIRYAGADNFTGRPVPGYAAAECLLLRDAAEALARVQKGLLQRKLTLKVYDCYRPRRAVRAFRAWVEAPEADPLGKRFYPGLDKSRLIDLGYIAGVSRHSRGDAVDLTLVALPAKRVPAFSASATYGPCTGPAAARAPDNGIDMGTGFDCFDALSHTKTTGLTPEQQRWRQVLVEAMAQQGFHNYPKEWWHFTYRPERRGRSFDVTISRGRH
jgi:D-alanyl-D-alanine dipeptidase